MKIDKFRIVHYGPLPDRGEINLAEFNLIYGVNEAGKTLTLEALIKLLLGKNIRDFKNIDRVEDEVDGYIIINMDGQKNKLGREKQLEKIVPVTPADCRNIFIIRNSDLSIEPEVTFYAEVTNRLTGLQTNRIKNLRKKILEISALTPGGDFSNRKEDGHLKTRVDDATRLLEEISLFKEEIKEKGVDEFEKNLIYLSDEIKKKERLRGKFEEARRRISYQKVVSSLTAIGNYKKSLKELSSYSYEDRNKWREVEREIERATIKVNELREELRKLEKELGNKEEELKNKKNEFEFAREKKEKTDKIRPRLTEMKAKLSEMSNGNHPIFLKSHYFIAVSILLALSISGLIIRESFPFLLLTITFGLFWLVLITSQAKNRRKKFLLERDLKTLKLDLAESGIEGVEFEDLLEEVESFSFKFKRQEEDIKEKEISIRTLANKKKEIKEETVPKLEEEKKKNEEVIREIKAIVSVDKLSDFDEKLNKKKELEKGIAKEETILEQILGKESRSERIKELEVYKDSARDVEFDEKEYEKIVKEISLEKNKFEKIENKIDVLSERMKGIERKTNKILPEENLRCNGSNDLENIYNKIKEFITEKENTKEDATVVMNILEEIANEEKTKIREQFGEKSPVSGYFSEMTGGLYTGVEFNEEPEGIEVTLKNGTKLPSWKLSGGTYDQLYFSIRLALGEKLFPEEKGFFILDDPFTKASHDRLEVLIGMLRKISKKGWQIIYFSAKEEIREILGNDKKVKLIELENIL